MRSLFIVFVFCLLCSCERWAIEKEPLNINSSFTISSYLTPDDSVHTVSVFSLKPADETILTKDLDNLLIKHASVFISSELDRTGFELKYVDSLMAYAGRFIVKENIRYFLSVKVNGKEATSSCLVPRKPLVTSDGIELIYLNEDMIHVKVTWKEPYGEQTSFRVIDQFRYGNAGSNIFSRSTFDVLDEPDPVTLEYAIAGDFFIPSTNFNNARFEVDIISLSPELAQLTQQMMINNIVIGVNSYGFFQKFIPLKPLYSNITNGYGVFGAYNTTMLKRPFSD